MPTDVLSEILSPTVALRVEAARQLGFAVEALDPETGYLCEVRHGDRRAFLLGGFSPLNNAVSARLAGDKFHTATLLSRVGFRVPAVARCLLPGRFDNEDFDAHSGLEPGRRFAEEHGFPLIVKPNRGARGRDVVEVGDCDEMEDAVRAVWRRDYLALVQERAVGIDVRLDFLDDSYLVGYVRRPVVLEGDGARTVRQLLADADGRFAGERFEEALERDPIWRRATQARSLGLGDVLTSGERLDFATAVLNLNRLCQAELVRAIPDRWLAAGCRAGEALGLRHWGVDFKVAPFTGGLENVDPNDAVVLEVNASPSVVQISRMGWRPEALAAETRVLEAIFRP